MITKWGQIYPLLNIERIEALGKYDHEMASLNIERKMLIADALQDSASPVVQAWALHALGKLLNYQLGDFWFIF